MMNDERIMTNEKGAKISHILHIIYATFLIGSSLLSQFIHITITI